MIGDDDAGTHQRVGKALARANRQVRRFEGNVVSFSGDGLMAIFPSSSAALRCGIGIQGESRQENMKVEPQQRIIFRVGIHAGELVFQGSRAGGDPLNIAARLERICQPGEICISAALLEQAEQARGISLESIGAHKLKNIRQPVEAYRVTFAEPVDAGEWPLAGRLPDLRWVKKRLLAAYFLVGPSCGTRNDLAAVPMRGFLHNGAPRKFRVVKLRSPCCLGGMSVEAQEMPILQRTSSKALPHHCPI